MDGCLTPSETPPSCPSQLHLPVPLNVDLGPEGAPVAGSRLGPRPSLRCLLRTVGRSLQTPQLWAPAGRASPHRAGASPGPVTPCCFLGACGCQGRGEGTARAHRPPVRPCFPVPLPSGSRPSVRLRKDVPGLRGDGTQTGPGNPEAPATSRASPCLLHRGPSPSLGGGTPSPGSLPVGMLPRPWGVLDKPLST